MLDLCLILCVVSICLNVYLIFGRKPPQEEKKTLTDDEIDKIKQVVNILTWGGEDEN